MTLAIVGSAINQNWLVSQLTRDDIFVITDGDDMHFNGLTKTTRGYEPNDRFSWDDYYALDDDNGIGIRRIRPSQWEIVLLHNGTRGVSVNCDLASLYAFPEDMSDCRRVSKEACQILWHHKKMWSYWDVIKTHLSLMVYDDNARKILRAMEKWEQTSRETCDWLKKMMSPQNEPRVEVHVADKLWLWYDRDQDTVTIGKGKQVWGKTRFGSLLWARAFNRASPIRNGWLIEFTHEERRLLRWNGSVVSTHSLFFPYGRWEKRGDWVWWPQDSTVFAPGEQFIFTPPQFTVVGASAQHALSVRRPDETGFLATNRVTMTDFWGIDTDQTLPFDEKIKRVCAGSESMLFVSYDRNTYVLNIVDISDLSFRPLVRSVLFRGNGDCVVYTIKSSPDIYAVAYQEFGVTPVRIFLIDTRGQVSLVPYAHHTLSFKDVFRTMMPQDNHLVVEVVDEKGNLTDQTLKIGMENKMGYVCFSDGITTHYETTKLGSDFWALINYLDQCNSDT